MTGAMLEMLRALLALAIIDDIKADIARAGSET